MERKKASNPFTRMPKDTMLEIFSYLNFRQLVTIRSVCSRWNNLINSNQSLFTGLFKRNFPLLVDRDKPNYRTWKEHYLRTLHSSIAYNFEKDETELFSRYLINQLEIKNPIHIGIRCALFRAGALLVENDVYGTCLDIRC